MNKFNRLISCFYNLKSFDLLVYLLSLYSIDNLFIKDQEHLETIKEKLEKENKFFKEMTEICIELNA